MTGFLFKFLSRCTRNLQENCEYFVVRIFVLLFGSDIEREKKKKKKKKRYRYKYKYTI